LANKEYPLGNNVAELVGIISFPLLFLCSCVWEHLGQVQVSVNV